MGSNTVEFTDSNFEQDALESNLPVLVDFWAARVMFMDCRLLVV